MNSVLAKLTAFLGDEHKHAKGVRDDLVFLQSELSAMNVVLHKLADVDQLDELSKDWRDRVQDLAYDIEDCIDLSVHRLGDASKSGIRAKVARMAKKIVSFRRIDRQIQQLKARVMEVSDRRNRYTLPGLVSTSLDAASSSKVDFRLCALWKETEHLVGIDGPRDDVIGRLMGQEESAAQHDVRMVSIVGCAGLGKTTLAKQVYDKIKGEFECKAFVSVSQKPNVKELLLNISTQVGKSTNTSDDVANLIDNLREHLKLRRYIVIVDDIWSLEPWRFIGQALIKTSPGSVIMVTTRVEEVAISSSSSHGGFVCQMKHLDDTHSKRLFYKRIFDSEEKCPPEFEQASKEILDRCDGIPLAIISISSFLADRVEQSLYHWNEVKKVMSSPLPGNEHLETLKSVLALSYYNLPHNVRNCLLYLSAFPEDCEIEKDHLISRWIAEGFINANPGESLYKAGLRYFNVLMNRSLIQPWYEHYGEVLTCRVHDVILNFIVSKSVEENSMTLLDTSDLVPLQHSNCCKVRRRLSLQGSFCQEETALMMKSIKPHVRSLACSMDCTGLHPLSEFKVVRVLDLQGCRSLINNHLANIEKLVHLRYLSIRRTGVSLLPINIGHVQHLETLDIRDSEVKELPQSIVQLQQLVRLFVNSDVKFPAKGVSKMQALEQLTGFSPLIQPVSIFKELGELTKLRVLLVYWKPRHIGDSDEVQAEYEKSYEKLFTSSLNALGRHNLHSLSLVLSENANCFSFDSWYPALKNIRRLYVPDITWRIRTFPGWIRLAAKLEQLELSEVYVKQDDLQMLGDLTALESLALPYSNTYGSWLTVSNHGFRSLKVAHIPNLLFMTDSMPNLKYILIEIRLEEVGENDLVFQHLPSTLCKVHAYIVGNPPLRDAVSKLEKKILNIANTHPNRPSVTTKTFIKDH
uniref:AAA+ ATPase domain-containing protein n=1 Tax=Oryza glumipatula TaxID=40148 RepID=A0A0E0A5H3_9ORYZ